MTPADQIERAARFHALHRRGAPLVLPNAWDGASARIFAVAGFPAIGTTSAGLAWSLGFADGERLPLDLLVETVARLAALVDVPLTVDIERGYGSTPEAVVGLVRRLLAVGAVGINIEDGSEPPEALCRKIEALRTLDTETGIAQFINARTDVYFRSPLSGAARQAEAIRRLRQFADAGADGVFAPGLADLDEITRVAEALPLPLNIYAGDGVPAVAALAAAGVARLSVGCGPMQATLALTRRIAESLRDAGTYETFTTDAFPKGEADRLFVPAG
jgi:2-methylisocitrate lyase-like PEP mutase family enzyme